MNACPHCGCTSTIVATVIGGSDPHSTWMCNATKRCGKYHRTPAAPTEETPQP